MFNKGFIILTVSRQEILVTDPSSKSSAGDPVPYAWSVKTIEQTIQEILEEHPTKIVRILLEDDMCYCIEADPGQTDESMIQEGRKRIPEVFTGNNIRISHLPKSKKVLLMVPIIDLWNSIHKSLCENGVTTELYCSIKEAAEYGATPSDGISSMEALKGEKLCKPKSKGKEVDDKVPSTVVESAATKAEQNRITPKRIALYIMIGILLLLIGFMGYVVWNMSPPPAPQPEVLQEITPTEAPTPTTIPVDISTIRVQVLNATGQAGVAGEVASLLSRENFNSIDTGNAPASEQGTNTIAIREATQAGILIPTVQDILKDYEFDNVGTPLDNDKYDLQVIIGK